MTRIDVTRLTASAALRLGLVVGFLAAAGCADSPTSARTDEPQLKAALQKHVDIYKAKTQDLKKGNTPKGK
jgi:hypothetical protein